MAHKESELGDIVRNAYKRLERPGCDSQQIPDYVHRKSGNEYVVTSVALREADLKPLVIYRKRNNNVKFARPLDEFLEKFRAKE